MTFILHCGNDLLTDLYKSFLKLKKNVPKMYFKTTANSLLGTVGTVDPFPVTSSNFKMTFSFAIVSNIAITTLKFVNKVGAKM